MKLIENNYLMDTIKEFTAENFKPLVVLLTSIITAHSPVHAFLDYDWREWMPFLEVLKTILASVAIIVSSIILVLNYFKKKKNV